MRDAKQLLASCLLALTALLAGHGDVRAAETAHEGILPVGSDLGEAALDEPREIFKTDISGGTRSYLVRLGDMAFSAPDLLGQTARQAGISCATCHRNGAGNAVLFIPGLSARPGTFDTTSGLFNPAADDHLENPVRVPSFAACASLPPTAMTGA